MATYDEYDSRGNVIKNWLPTKSSSLSTQSISAITAAAQITYGQSEAYSTMTYDGVDQISTQIGPGKTWHDDNKKVEISTVPAGSVTRYEAPLDNTSLVRKGTYAAGTLSCQTSTDEDGLKVS